MKQVILTNQELRIKKQNQNYYRIHLMDENDCNSLIRLYGVDKSKLIIKHVMSTCDSFKVGDNILPKVINLGGGDVLLISSHNGEIVHLSVFSMSKNIKSGITFHDVLFGYKEGEKDSASKYRMISRSLTERMFKRCV